MIYTVKEVAARLGISEHTIRYYDRKGLMPFLHKNNTGKRMFTEEDICLLELIKCLKSGNMSLSDIKEYITLFITGDEAIEMRKILLEKQRVFILQQIEVLNQSLCAINYKLEHCVVMRCDV